MNMFLKVIMWVRNKCQVVDCSRRPDQPHKLTTSKVNNESFRFQEAIPNKRAGSYKHYLHILSNYVLNTYLFYHKCTVNSLTQDRNG